MLVRPRANRVGRPAAGRHFVASHRRPVLGLHPMTLRSPKPGCAIILFSSGHPAHLRADRSLARSEHGRFLCSAIAGMASPLQCMSTACHAQLAGHFRGRGGGDNHPERGSRLPRDLGHHGVSTSTGSARLAGQTQVCGGKAELAVGQRGSRVARLPGLLRRAAGTGPGYRIAGRVSGHLSRRWPAQPRHLAALCHQAVVFAPGLGPR